MRQLYLDVHYWTDYLCDKPEIDKEFQLFRKDFHSFGKDVKKKPSLQIILILIYFSNETSADSLFGRTDYVRMKLRTLLKHMDINVGHKSC